VVAKPGIALRRAAQASKWGQCPISNPPSDHEYHAAPQPVSAIVQPVDTFDDRQVSSSAAAAAEVLDAYQAQPKPARRIAVFESYDPLAVINRHIGLTKRQWPPSLIVAIPSRPPERNNLIVPKSSGSSMASRIYCSESDKRFIHSFVAGCDPAIHDSRHTRCRFAWVPDARPGTNERGEIESSEWI
jgi:hypothetical protein